MAPIRKNEQQDSPVVNGGAERYPQRRRAHPVVMMLFLGVAVAGVLAPVLLANNGRNLDVVVDWLGNPAGQKTQAGAGGRTERVPLPQPSRPSGTDVSERAAQARHRPIPMPALSSPATRLAPPVPAWLPQQGCEALKPGATGEKPVFLATPDGRAECTILIAYGQETTASALFLQIRSSGGLISSLRMKLNVGKDGREAALAADAAAIAREILTPISEDEARYLRTRMAERQPFRTNIGDYHMTFRAEGNDETRFNFIAVRSEISGEAGTEPDREDRKQTGGASP
ncbi:DUF6030 family protein [Neorhizobium sp. NPDC001467]|uniref:DUF6030 family protein n=1 Tax=Neorhizobium sp. NPDC001467 TaxID=3390595 RepID=UPI003D025488